MPVGCARATHGLARVFAILALVVAFAALASPVTVRAAEQGDRAAAQGEVENLGEPISSYLTLDSVLGEDAQGRPTLYGSTYNAPSDGVEFFGVDPVTGEIRTLKTMDGAWGPYHVVRAPDGRIYLGPLNSRSQAEIWEYDPRTDELKMVAVAPVEGSLSFCFGMAASPNGKIYCGAYGSGVYEYDPNTGAVRLVVTTRSYPKGLLALDERRLVVAQGTEASVLVVDVVTGAVTEVLPEKYRDYSFAYNAVRVGDSVYVQLVTPDQKIVEFDADTMAFRSEVSGLTGMSFGEISKKRFTAIGPKPDGTGATLFYVNGPEHKLKDTGVEPNWMVGPRLWPLSIDHQPWLTSVGTTGLLGRWNPRTGEVWTHQLDLPGDPKTIQALATGPDGTIYGGGNETNGLFGYDPTTGESTVYGNVAPGRTGNICSMASIGGRLFIGSYTHNVVTVYDPSRPWNPGDSPDSNPIDLGPVGEEQYRPFDMKVGPDGRVWVASSAAYGKLGGALTAIDPDSLQVESFRYLAGDQQLFSLAVGDGVLYAGTSRYGDDTDAGGDAQLVVFDVTTERVVHATVPVPGANRITALAAAPDGTLFGAADGQWFRYNPATREVIVLGPFPHGAIGGLLEGPDGDIYGHTAGTVFRLDPETAIASLVAEQPEPGAAFRTMAFDGAGRLYWGAGASLFRTEPVSEAALQSGN